MLRNGMRRCAKAAAQPRADLVQPFRGALIGAQSGQVTPPTEPTSTRGQDPEVPAGRNPDGVGSPGRREEPDTRASQLREKIARNPKSRLVETSGTKGFVANDPLSAPRPRETAYRGRSCFGPYAGAWQCSFTCCARP